MNKEIKFRVPNSRQLLERLKKLLYNTELEEEAGSSLQRESSGLQLQFDSSGRFQYQLCNELRLLLRVFQ